MGIVINYEVAMKKKKKQDDNNRLKKYLNKLENKENK